MEQQMKETFDTLELIEKVSSRNTKMDTLHRLRHNEFAKFYFETIFNPFLTYGTTVDGTKIPISGEPTLNSLRNMRASLADRKVTGDNARILVNGTCSTEDPQMNRWLKAMWNRDLRIGLSTTSINKVFPGLIPEFQLQCCTSIQGELSGEWIAQPKFDGIRSVFIFRDNQCTVLSRNGKELTNVDHIVQELLPHISNGVLDGELLAENWNDTASVVHTKGVNAKTLSLKFHIFDHLTIDEWISRKGERSLEVRQILLNEWASWDTWKHVAIVKSVPVNNTAHAWELAEDYRTNLGLEGAVIKNMRSKYQFAYTSDWLKVKFTETVDVRITGFQEGTGKHVGKLGAFLCDYNGKMVNVGGGLTDDQRNRFWQDRSNMVDKYIEVKCQEITKDFSLRFPVFLRLREDKS